jgi:hypothetical protein
LTADHEIPVKVRPSDQWALAYIGVPYLQEIIEAVDADGAGFVSVEEANAFALRRPEGWRYVVSSYAVPHG